MAVFGRIIVVLLMLGVGTSGLWSALLFMELTDAVNTKRSAQEQFPIIGDSIRYFAIRRAYQSMFPDGSLLRRMDTMIKIGFACLAAAFLILLATNHS